jgi:Flp pilus assembly protein TadG
MSAILGRARRGTTDRSQGQSLVEFALVLPIMLFLFMILFDFGRAVYAYSTVADAARQGVRYAIVNQSTGTIQSTAAGAATALGIVPTSVEVAFHPAGTTVGTCSPLDLGCVAEVRVPYRWTAITPIISNVIGQIDMSSTARMPVERVYP